MSRATIQKRPRQSQAAPPVFPLQPRRFERPVFRAVHHEAGRTLADDERGEEPVPGDGECVALVWRSLSSS